MTIRGSIAYLTGAHKPTQTTVQLFRPLSVRAYLSYFGEQVDDDGSGYLDFDEFLVWWQNQNPEAQKQLELLMDLNFDDL